MGIGNFVIICLMVYYTLYFISFISAGKKNIIITHNKRLEELRLISLKTVEEQKEFIELKYPKSKWTFSWQKLPVIVGTIILVIILFRIYGYILDYFKLDIALFWAIPALIIIPILVNLILKKFHLEKNDISIFFRGAK